MSPAAGNGSSRSSLPAAIVIFGASGDLTRRKLVPALFSLARQKLLAPHTTIVGISRSPFSDDEFRERMLDGVTRLAELEFEDTEWADFAPHLRYMPGSFTEADTFVRLKGLLSDLDERDCTKGHRLFYLSTAPDLFAPIIEGLGRVGLNLESEDAEDGAFSRVVIEKPFGEDLASARQLNERVSTVFRERQVYRIDHYLGKETVQNLMVLRFGNTIFEPIWNRRYIDHVQITVAEDLGVGTRGGYYEQSGALRDIVQNHVMQLMAIIAMEPPARFDSRDVRDEKVKVLRAIPPFEAKHLKHVAVRGQYDAGRVGNEDVRAYRDADGVDPQSNTETFVALKIEVDNWRWAGTPFYVRTGKRLPTRATEITLQFRPAPHLPFAGDAVDAIDPNLLSLRIQPDEGSSLQFIAKAPGPKIELRTVSMDFAYGSSFIRRVPDAYERLLLDCLLGDSTLFTRWDEVERAWEILDPLLSTWEARPGPYPNYAAGTWGPLASDELLARDGREWRRL
jgi:glucose-6-phosphate 1-dehydrogenase